MTESSAFLTVIVAPEMVSPVVESKILPSTIFWAERLVVKAIDAKSKEQIWIIFLILIEFEFDLDVII